MNEPSRRIFDGAVVVTLITFAAYFLTYNYERGFADFWNIPSSLIVIGPSDVFGAALGFVGISFLVLMVLGVAQVLDRIDRTGFEMLASFLLVASLVAASETYHHGWEKHWRTTLVFFLIVGGVAMAGYFFMRRRFGSEAMQSTMDRRGAFDFLGAFLSQSRILILAVVGCITALPGAYALGAREATTTEAYLIARIDGHAYALLRIYGETFIFRLIDLKRKDFHESLYVYKNTDKRSGLLLIPWHK